VVTPISSSAFDPVTAAAALPGEVEETPVMTAEAAVAALAADRSHAETEPPDDVRRVWLCMKGGIVSVCVYERCIWI
jgi:hypothetical protein